jgi:hypothetical protein
MKSVAECLNCKTPMVDYDNRFYADLIVESKSKKQTIENMCFCCEKCLKEFQDKLCHFTIMCSDWIIMKEWVLKKYLENKDCNNDPKLSKQCREELKCLRN